MSKSIEEFEKHFGEVYGDRWPALRAALLEKDREKVALQNPFMPAMQDYFLDEASLAPVRALQMVSGLRIADFCASPGGKTLASIFSVRGEGEWFCSDLSPARVQRLKAILHDCVPAEILRERIHVRQADASRTGMRFPENFDRVLVDAPCSGEKHLLATPRELERWSLKGSKRLAVRQHSLLCSGLDAVKSGGIVVYSTCSISHLENDGVIEKLMKSREGKFEVLPVREEKGEATAHGWIILPDVAGAGPIYFSALRKI